MGLLVTLYLALGIQFGISDMKPTKQEIVKKPVVNIMPSTVEGKPADGDGW
jgi:hypothetical protein